MRYCYLFYCISFRVTVSFHTNHAINWMEMSTFRNKYFNLLKIAQMRLKIHKHKELRKLSCPMSSIKQDLMKFSGNIFL